MKKVLKIVILIIVLVALFIVFMYCAIANVFVAPPTVPKVIHAEFPIKITCKVSGEEYIIEDSVVCDYKGIKSESIGSKVREWDNYLKNAKGTTILLLSGESGSGNFYIYKSAGDAEYYMGEHNYENNLKKIESPDGFYISYYDEIGKCLDTSWITREEAFEKYGFELVSVEHTPPLVGNCD